jgi:hypothetical protein
LPTDPIANGPRPKKNFRKPLDKRCFLNYNQTYPGELAHTLDYLFNRKKIELRTGIPARSTELTTNLVRPPETGFCRNYPVS